MSCKKGGGGGQEGVTHARTHACMHALFLYTVMFSTSEKAFGFLNGFGGIRCDSPEPERPTVPDVRPNYMPRVDYARNDRRAGNKDLEECHCGLRAWDMAANGV